MASTPWTYGHVRQGRRRLHRLTEESLEQVALEDPHHPLKGSFELLLLRPPQFSAVLVQEPQGPGRVCSREQAHLYLLGRHPLARWDEETRRLAGERWQFTTAGATGEMAYRRGDAA